MAAALVGGGTLVWPHIATVTSPYATPDDVVSGGQRLQPLGHPPRAPHGVGEFSFVAEQVMSDRPVAYDPCRKLPWAIRDELAPAGSERLVVDAVRRVARATGLVFEQRNDPAHYSSIDTLTTNYGQSPLVVDWTTPEDEPPLRGDRFALSRSVYMTDWGTAQKFYVTGAVALDAPQLTKVLARPSGPEQVRAVVMRELAHALGLDYVDDPAELMDPQSSGRTSFGPGDREGLAALGGGRCFGTPPRQ